VKLSKKFLLVLGFGLSALVASQSWADDLTPPYVASAIPNLTVPAGTFSSVVKLKNTFALSGVTQPVVRFTTVLGNIDVQLRPDVAPLTVANFLGYVNSTVTGANYNSSIIHRSVPGFIIQGGGYYLTSASLIGTITAGPTVANEFHLSNTRGTIAMAKLGSDPNSATDQWFFNLADNSANLDSQNGGFTVFGSVIEGDLATMDAIANVPVPNPGPLASPFDSIPLLNYTYPNTVAPSNLVIVNSVAPIALLNKSGAGPSLLSLKVKNTNPGLLRATISGQKLTLYYATGATGKATITVVAVDSAGTKAKASFKVKVK
jgi:cyclophilin family peptidyl-prolyl cis-trans isomerase